MGQKNTRTGSSAGGPLNLPEIQKLMDLLAERGISEFEMEKDGLRIRIKCGQAPLAAPLVPTRHSTPSATRVHEVPNSAAIPTAAPAAAAPPEMPSRAESSVEAAEGLHVIKSPIVGTFYAAPAPNAPPFVKPGDAVQVGQVLCIIEAMKLMNEIESEITGEMVRIYVESGQPVEYGQALFAIKPSRKK